jgi:hypothetical protein
VNRSSVAAFAAAVLTTCLALSLPASADAQESVAFSLMARNSSGVSGSATLTPVGNQTRVVLQLQSSTGPHAAQIYGGACDNLEPAPRFILSPVQNGRSETVVNSTIQQILLLPPALTVRTSAGATSDVVACGSVSAAAAAVLVQQIGAVGPAESQPVALPPLGAADPPPLPILLALAGLTLVGGGALALWRGRKRVSSS